MILFLWIYIYKVDMSIDFNIDSRLFTANIYMTLALVTLFTVRVQ